MSSSNGYQTVGNIKNNKKKGGSEVALGRKKVWIEVKVSSEIDAKASNPSINKRPAKGIPGKLIKSPTFLSQVTVGYSLR